MMRRVHRMLALLTWLLYTMKVAATQTVVAHWEFTTGYDVEKNGATAIYTPNTLGWSAPHLTRMYADS